EHQFTDRVVAAIRDLANPLGERMRRRGLERARQFDRSRWREQFARLVEDLLDTGGRPFEPHVEVRPRSTSRTVAVGAAKVLGPVGVVNRASHPAAASGPARLLIHWWIQSTGNLPGEVAGGQTALPGLVMPGRATAAAVPVAVPPVPGTYRVGFRVGPA